MGQRAPDFFIVGAPKAGTDALYYDLDQHPEIFMSPLKEPCFFSTEIRLENFEASQQAWRLAQRETIRQYINGPMNEKRFGGVVSDWSDYLQLFRGATDQKAVGEGSVCYLWSKTAADGIASRLPRARIIIVLMDPRERAFAQYLKSVSNGSVTHSFRRHLEICMNLTDTRLSLYHPFLEFGLYTEQIRRFRNAFPDGQLHISFHEEAVADHPRWFSGILQFLGVDPGFTPERGTRGYEAAVPRFARLNRTLRGVNGALKQLLPVGLRHHVKKTLYRSAESLAMSHDERAMLTEYYRSDVHALEALLNQNLSHWLAEPR